MGQAVKKYSDIPEGFQVYSDIPEGFSIATTAISPEILASRQAASTAEFNANNPETGIVSGIKRGLQNLNPINIVRGLGPELPVSTPVAAAGQVSNYQAGLKHIAEHPIATAVRQVPIVGGILGDLAERFPSDPSGVAAEAMTTTAVPGASFKILGKLGRSVPTAARAGAKFQIIKAAAGDLPISTTEVDQIVNRALDLSKRGFTKPKVINDYIRNRKAATGDFMGQQVTDPMTYEVGRDFASSSGELSASEHTALKPIMKRQVSLFAKAMKEANRDAAARAGMGDLYDQAIREYRQAKTIEAAGEVLKKWGVRAAITAAGASAGYRILKDIVP